MTWTPKQTMGGAGPPWHAADVRLALPGLLVAVAAGPIVVLFGAVSVGVLFAVLLFAAVLVHPPAAAYAYLAAMPLVVGVNRGALPIPLLRANEVLLLIVAGGLATRWAFSMWDRSSLEVRLTTTDLWAVAVAAGTSLWPLATMTVRARTITSGDILYSLSMWKYLLVYAVIRFTIRNSTEVARALAVSMAAAGVVAVVGVLQALQLLGIADVLANHFAPEEQESLVYISRATSTLASSIAMADVMVFHLAVAVAWLARGGRHRALLLAATVLFLLGALAAGQFSGFIGLIVGVAAVGLVTGQLARVVRFALPAVALAAVVVTPVISRRLAGFADGGLPQSWEGRLHNLQTYFWPQLADPVNLIFGVRPEARAPGVEWWEEWVWIESGHTWLLWVGGVPLLVTFAVFLIVAGRQTWKRGRRRADPVGVAASAAFAAVVVIAVLTTFDPHISMRGAADTFFALLALAAAGLGRTNPAGPVRRLDVALVDPDGDLAGALPSRAGT